MNKFLNNLGLSGNLVMRNSQKIIVAVLLVLAIVLGFFVYKKTHLQAKSLQSVQTNQTKIGDNSLSDNEKRLLAVPGPNAPADEIKQHSELAAKLAVLGNEIEIGDCKAKPLVLQVKQATTFNLKNSGSSKVAITFDSNLVTYLDSGKSTAVKASLNHGPGLYGYRCTTNNFNAISGFVLISP